MKKYLPLGIFLLTSVVFGDDLLLRDGRKITGKVSESGDEYILERGEKLVIRFPREEVRAVEKKITVEERYENLRAVVDEKNAASWLKLAKWCRENQLHKQARAAFEQVVALEPENAEARRGAGYQKENGEWLTRAEWQKKRGRELYNGEWYDQAEAVMLRDRDRRAQELKQNRVILQSVLKQCLRLTANDDTEPLAEKLAALSGAGAWAMLDRAANDIQLKTRETAYRALAKRGDAEKLDLLSKRLRYEESPRLIEILSAQLSEFSPKNQVVEKMLALALHSPVKRTRRRAAPIIAATADYHLIDSLIEIVEVAAENSELPKKESTAEQPLAAGWSSSESPAAEPAIYPACELLQFLTGQKFRHDERAKWEEWWAQNRDNFSFNRYALVKEGK